MKLNQEELRLLNRLQLQHNVVYDTDYNGLMCRIVDGTCDQTEVIGLISLLIDHNPFMAVALRKIAGKVLAPEPA